MSGNYRVNQIYDEIIQKVTKTEEIWKSVCRMAGQIYRYEFDNVLMVYGQKPNATLVADYDSWKKVNRYVRRGSKGIAIYPSRALKPYMRYVFDISDTGGAKKNITWSLDETNLGEYLNFLKRHEGLEYKEVSDFAGLQQQFWDFTKEEIRSIIKENHAMREKETIQLLERALAAEDSELARKDAENILFHSLYCAIGTRCGIRLSKEEENLEKVTMLREEDAVCALGNLVSDVSCQVLRSINKNLIAMEQERRMQHGSVELGVSRGTGRNVISEHSDGRTVGDHTGQVRDHGDGISEGESLRKVSHDGTLRDTEREDEGSGRGSEPVTGQVNGGLSEKTQATGYKLDHGDVENPRAGNANGGGDRVASDRVPVSLEMDKTKEEKKEDLLSEKTETMSEEAENELQQELEELENMGRTNGEAEYDQASLFDYMGTTSSGSYMEELKRREAEEQAKGTYTYLNPKVEKEIPHDYIVQVLQRGSGFENGKKRIYEIYQKENVASERVKQLRKEYGQGGAGWPVEGYGLHGYDTFQGKGIRLQWMDEEGHKEGYVSWNTVEREIGALILTGMYYEPAEEIQEAEYTENSSMDEAMEADTEYQENGEKLQPAIMHIDYAQIVADMDEDLREALEFLVSGCTLFSAYKPFLQDLVNTDLLLMPNRLEFLSNLALRGEEERDGYYNNKYGLIVYKMKPFSFSVNHMNKSGKRVVIETGYRELYEVLSYMVKREGYCSKEQRKHYEESMEAEDRSKINPVYQKYLEKCDQRREILAKQEERRKTEPISDTPKENGQKLVDTEKPQDYHIDTLQTEHAGAKTRFGWNIDAITTLKKIEAEERTATQEEQKVLAKYVGWGGLAQAFDEKNESWSSEYRKLKEVLNDAEYRAARETVTNAFYTPPEVAAAIYTGLVQFGFQGGNVLEPSMGKGVFFGTMPETLKSNSHLFGVEQDSVTGRIAKQLYPNAGIQIKGFEQAEYEDNFFDVVVGNVPFGDFKLYDRKHNPMEFKIHDHFIAKSIDHVRPGGIVALVTTKGTMDKKNPTVRKYLAERAELIGAIRLPNHVFKAEAGTEVTSDILFFQKRERKIVTEPDWVHLGMTEEGIPVNSYFAEHPEMILGKMQYDTGRFGENSAYTTCVNGEENFSLYDALQQAIQNISAKITEFEQVMEENETIEESIPADPDVKNFTYAFVDGKLYYRKDSRMYLQNVGEKQLERIKGMLEIRQATRNLIQIQSDGCSEEELKAAQEKLNTVYDAYVKKYDSINATANARAFRDDGDYPLLCSLEIVDEDGKVTKADMFTKQTIRAKSSVQRVETAVEALNVSVNEFNGVNIPFMLSIYEPDIEKEKEKVAEQSQNPVEEVVFSEELTKQLQRNRLVEELQGLIFLNPQEYNENDEDHGWETADEYLSGNVRDKLRVAKAMAKEQPEVFAGNVTALEQVQPKDLDASEIDVRIGTTWIEPEDYEAFIYELLHTPKRARNDRNSYFRSSGIQVNLNKYNMEWFIENKAKDKHSIATTKTYGTSRMDAYTIFEATLNLRTVQVRDRIEDGDGKYHYEVNQKETMLAREKQNQMKEAFREWIFRDVDRRKKYVDYYNETFNNIRLREYDGSHLEFPGMNPDIHLKSHQVNAVARVLMGGNTLLAHCVGAGKSFEMMAACMEQKRLGLANKTAMIVPKSLVGQTASEFLRLYPSANILVATERDFEKSRRKQFISRIAMGDYDCIIMSHSQFEKIPISRERKEAMLNRQIDDISYAIQEMKEKNSEKWTIKQMEANKKRLEEQLKKMTDESRKDNLITFEELGIDSIMVDEAHMFKNLAIFSKMNVSGITGSGSQRAMDMFLKCEYINEINGGRGIVFATGTPISNTMCEMYVMQSFLQKDTLEQLGIYHFDSWAANFGEQTTALELSVEGSGFRFKTRFNKFTNLPQLMNLFKDVADIQTRDMLDLDVPKLRGDKYQIVESEPDWYVKQVMEDFVRRAEAIRGGGVDPSEDNFLKITHEARLLGTDARLLATDAPNNPDGKLNKVIENVMYEYQRAKEQGVIGTQLIFSDIGTPKTGWKEEMLTMSAYEFGSFDVYNYIKTELVKQGIPADEIAFIHDANSDAKKDALFREMRAGTKKILIGSTDKCGTGVNVQTHLVAMHHVDCPWKPSSIEQREGRGLRQGNENKEVAVYRYVTKGTFDAYSWSLVENKQRFISQVMTSKAVSRTCEDIDEATLSYAEIKAVATGNPLIKEKMEIDNDVQRLKMLKASYDSQHYALQDQFMVKFPKLIAAAKEKLACVQADVKYRDEHKLPEGEFLITIGKVQYTERVEAGTALLSAISKCKTGEQSELGMFKGFTLFVDKNFMGLNYLVLRGKTEYKVEMSTSPVGNMVKLENCFDGMQNNIEFLEKKLEEYHRDMEQAKLEYEKPFSHEAELREKIARQNELNVQLDLENQVIDVEAKEAEEPERKSFYHAEEVSEQEDIVAEPERSWSR